MIHTYDLPNFGERLARAMHYAGVRKNTVLAARVGIAEGTIRNWLKRDLAPPGKSEALAKIAEFLGVSLSWLQDGIGPMVIGAAEDSIPYRDGDLSPAKRIILQILRSELERMSDEEAATWFTPVQKAFDRQKRGGPE